MREYPVIDSASSVEQLKLRLKPEDFEKYGDPFIPEYVYQIVRDLPRFRDMRRGPPTRCSRVPRISPRRTS